PASALADDVRPLLGSCGLTEPEWAAQRGRDNWACGMEQPEAEDVLSLVRSGTAPRSRDLPEVFEADLGIFRAIVAGVGLVRPSRCGHDPCRPRPHRRRRTSDGTSHKRNAGYGRRP